MINIINTLLQPFIYLLVLLVELYRALAPEEVSMKDTIRNARGHVKEVKASMKEFEEEFKEEPTTKKEEEVKI